MRTPVAAHVKRQHALAEKAFSAARWKATSVGVATGLPANPWTAFPAATADVAVGEEMGSGLAS